MNIISLRMYINFFRRKRLYVRSTDAPSNKFFYEVKGKMSEGLSPSLLFLFLKENK